MCVGFKKVTFEQDLRITEMHSSEGEVVELKYKFYPSVNVEQWLLLLEDTMRHTSTVQPVMLTAE